MNWLRIIHFLGLTNLSDEDVRRFEIVGVEIGTRFDKRLILIFSCYFFAIAFFNCAVFQLLFTYSSRPSVLVGWLSAILFVMLAILASVIAEIIRASLTAESIGAYLKWLDGSGAPRRSEVTS
jgi:hypothetical protein